MSSGRDHARGMELDELHVHQPAASLQGEEHALAEVLVPARGAAAPQARMPATAEDDSIGHERGASTVVQVERERAEASAVSHEEAGDVLVLDDRNPETLHLGHEGLDDRPSRVVAGVARTAPSVRAEEPLVEGAVVRTSEVAAPRGELFHGGGCFPDDHLHNARITEEIALAEGVDEVLLPAVLRVPSPECGVDAARGEHGVGVRRAGAFRRR